MTFRERVALAQRARLVPGSPEPFLVFTPLAAPSLLPELPRTRLPRWPHASTALHVRWSDDAGLAKAEAFEELWATYPDDASYTWLTDAAYADLLARKPALRAAHPGVTHALGPLFPFHLPDPHQLAAESAVLRWWLR